MTPSAVQNRLPLGITLQDPNGEPKRLGDVLVSSWSVIQLVRYSGCLLCQEWLVGLDRAAPLLAERGAAAVAVGGSADYQARWLQRERAVTMPLLLHPDQNFRAAVGSHAPWVCVSWPPEVWPRTGGPWLTGTARSASPGTRSAPQGW